MFPPCTPFTRYAESFKDFRDFPPVKTNADAVAFTVLLKVREQDSILVKLCVPGYVWLDVLACAPQAGCVAALFNSRFPRCVQVCREPEEVYRYQPLFMPLDAVPVHTCLT